MIPAVTAIVLLCALGAPAVLAVDRHVAPGTLLGLSYLFGAVLATLILLFLTFVGVPWAPGSFAGAAMPPFAALVWLAVRRRRAPPPSEKVKSPMTAGAIVLDSLTLLAVVGHGIFATLAPLGQWDFWADWGLKAKVFWSHRGLDWAFLGSPENFFAHRDYPPLLPLTLDFFSLVRGGWEDRWMGLVFTAFAAALLLVARDFFREELGSARLASLATLAVAGPALVIWVGLAEGPLIAYGCLGLLMVRRALRGSHASGTFGALLLGGAALTKNEGVALLASAALASLSVQSWRISPLRRLWPAAALAAVWLVPRSLHGLSSELLGGAVGSRLLGRFLEPGPFITALRELRWAQPWVWFGAAATFLLFPGSVRREKFVLVAVGLQLFASLLVYAASPHPLLWHIRNSSERLVAQHTFVLAFAAVAILLGRLPRPEIARAATD